MKTSAFDRKEEARLAELLSCQILDTPTEKEFDQLTEMAAEISGCPSAAISFIDRDRQWFKSSIGLAGTEAPRNITFCTHTILSQDILLVEDATKDERFADNPGVTGDPNVRFYAGVPIVSSRGYNLGTVCVFDSKPHEMTETQKKYLSIIAGQVTKLVELHVRNLLLREQAKEQIDMEKKTVQYALRQQEEERQSIGVQLHENFAQVLAACSLYLNMAEEMQPDGQHFLSKARMELGKLTEDVRLLSRRVSPISLHEIDFREVLAESVESISRHSGLHTELVVKGSVTNLAPSHSVTLLRVIIQYLELLRTKKEISSVSVELSMNKTVHLSMSFEASHPPQFSLFERVTVNAILNRVESEEGTVKFHEYGLEVTLPGKCAVVG